MKKNKTKKIQTNEINQKMKYRYQCIHEDINELQRDTKQVLNSQFEELAKNTPKGISNVPRLTNALEEEADMLDKASNKFLKLSTVSKQQADEIRTRVKEANDYEKEQHKKIKILPATPTNAQIDYQETKKKHFAAGFTFYKLFWVFFIGCFGGVVIETIWCIIRNGHYESRVGLIYGPFNLVYGIGALVLTYFLYQYRNRSRLYSFIGGFITGSIVEYACSWFQEIIFGSTSWDYSAMPFNINGRICLLYSIFWGILGIYWIKTIYPYVATWILKIPNKIGKPLTTILLVFMIINSINSGLVVNRWYKRDQGNQATNIVEKYIDKHYPDTRMEKIYANLDFKD